MTCRDCRLRRGYPSCTTESDCRCRSSTGVFPGHTRPESTTSRHRALPPPDWPTIPGRGRPASAPSNTTATAPHPFPGRELSDRQAHRCRCRCPQARGCPVPGAHLWRSTVVRTERFPSSRLPVPSAHPDRQPSRHGARRRCSYATCWARACRLRCRHGTSSSSARSPTRRARQWHKHH